jgi:hypothetical protein
MFPDTCCDWRCCPILEQTWATFKINFALAHQELCDSQVTSNQAGYQQAANAAYDTASYDIQQETALAIANLATATASDRSTVANLTATNSSLSIELSLANAKLNAVTAELSALQIAMATVCSTGTQQAAATRNRPAYVTNGNYCWTYGYRVGPTHTSATCTAPRDGHQTTATRANTMGGSTCGHTAWRGRSDGPQLHSSLNHDVKNHANNFLPTSYRLLLPSIQQCSLFRFRLHRSFSKN